MQNIASRITQIVIGFRPNQTNRVILQPIFKDGKSKARK